MSVEIVKSNFIKELLADIKEADKKLSAIEFIYDRNLTEVKVTNEEELPTMAMFGTIYLIKNNSIIIVSSCPMIKNFDPRVTMINNIWECNVNIYNLSRSDVSEFSSCEYLLSINELVSYDSERSMNFIMSFIRNKFAVYVRK
jgi:hypothetical protein